MKHLLYFISLLALSPLAFAQTHVNYTGTYRLNKEKTDFGEVPQDILPVSYILKQDGNNFNLTTNCGDGTSYVESLIAGGPEVSTTLASGLVRKASLQWNPDKTSFTISSNSGDQGSKMTVNWSLSEDGKTLIVDRNVEQANGVKYEVKGIYDRQ